MLDYFDEIRDGGAGKTVYKKKYRSMEIIGIVEKGKPPKVNISGTLLFYVIFIGGIFFFLVPSVLMGLYVFFQGFIKRKPEFRAELEKRLKAHGKD